MVGLTAVLQQTPLSVISAPLLEVTFPPPVTVEVVVPLTLAVVTAGFEASTIFNVLGTLEPQVLSAVTEMVPPVAPTVAVIEFELELPLQPDGKVQVYEVAPDTAEILYVWDDPWHKVADPVIA